MTVTPTDHDGAVTPQLWPTEHLLDAERGSNGYGTPSPTLVTGRR